MSDNKFITGKQNILWLMVARQYLLIAPREMGVRGKVKTLEAPTN
jgi:hypothetical protein